MEGLRIVSIPVLRISAHEPAGKQVVVSGAEIVEAKVRVELFAAVEIFVGRYAGVVGLTVNGVLPVCVSDGAG